MLPKIEKPIFELVLPVSEKKIKFNLLSGKEEKILLLAKESNEPREYLLACQQIISNCCLDRTIDVHKLTTYEIEYIFLQLRCKSIGETVDIRFSGRPGTQCKSCQKDRTVKVNLSDVKLVHPTVKHSNNIKLSADVGVILKHPTYDSLLGISDFKSTVDGKFELIAGCVESIYDGDSIHQASDISKPELLEFLLNLSQKDLSKMNNYLENIPKLSHTVNLTCDECGYSQEVVLEGLNDFF